MKSMSFIDSEILNRTSLFSLVKVDYKADHKADCKADCKAEWNKNKSVKIVVKSIQQKCTIYC